MAHQNELGGTSGDDGEPIVEDSTGTGTSTHGAGLPVAAGAVS